MFTDAEDGAVRRADQPVESPDPRKRHFQHEYVHNQKRFGFTTIMISHDIPDVFFISGTESSFFTTAS